MTRCVRTIIKTKEEQKMENLKYLNVNPDIEGFLAKDGVQFNGVVFLMREPNTGGEKADDFWFKNCLNGTIPDRIADEKAYKGKFYTYNKKFIRLLSYIYQDKNHDRVGELKHSAYFNLRPDGGNARMSEAYKALRDTPDQCKYRFGQILAYCTERIRTDDGKGTLNIFTCWDIANALQKHKIIPKACDDLTQKNGAAFKHGEEYKRRDYVQFEHNGLAIHIYAIDHPSYSSHVCYKGE